MNLNQIPTMPDMRSGHILKYERSKGCGVIFSCEERYFFHSDRIIKGPVHPPINAPVLFVPGKLHPSQQMSSWKLPPAYSIIVLEVDAGFQSLAAQEVK